MKDLGLEIRYVEDLRRADEDTYRAMNAFSDATRSERLPDDPPVSLEERIAGWRSIPPFVDVRVWHARPIGSDRIIASASLDIADLPENRHLAGFGIDVLPEWRRRGIATALLGSVARAAQEAERTLLMTGSCDRVPAGDTFLTRLGAKRTLETHTNQLDIAADLDRGLLRVWQERAAERASGFRLEFSRPPIPEEDLERVLALVNAVDNTIPRGEMDVEDSRMTAEHLRQMQAADAARGNERRLCIAVETATGEYAGYTMVHWHPNRPWLLHQDATGTLPAYRNKGLGRWMKAALLDRTLEELPDLRFVRTNNADTNAAMLGINREMGFKPFMADIMWQVPTEQVFAYLAAKNHPGHERPV